MFEQRYLDQAVQLAIDNVRDKGGRPFGSVITKDGEVVSTGVNELLETGDPTAHAEMQAIRAAAQALGSLRLEGCTIYASGEPCPMCLSAIYLAGASEVFFAYSKTHGAKYGVAALHVYAEIGKPVERQMMPIAEKPASALLDSPYTLWQARTSKP